LQKLVLGIILLATIILPYLLAGGMTLPENKASNLGVAQAGLQDGSKTLAEMKGMVLRNYPVKRLEGPTGFSGWVTYGVMCCDELTDFTHFLGYFISKGPISEKTEVGYARYNQENIYVYKAIMNKTEVLVAVGDLGDFYIRVGDGKAGAYQVCNHTINYPGGFKGLVLENIIMGRLNAASSVDIIWGGQYGEMTGYQSVAYICDVVNGTVTTCTTPESPQLNVVFHNPYEVFYIYIDGYRLEPPIRIRCCNPEFGGFHATYVEGFIPTLRKPTEFTLDDSYIGKIVESLKNNGLSTDAGNLVVDDMYLALSSRGEQLVPVVVLRAGNTVAWVEFRQDGPYVKGVAGTMGSTPVKGDYRLDWNKILANIEHPDTPEQAVQRYIAYAIVATGVAAVSLMIYYHVRKIRKK